MLVLFIDPAPVVEFNPIHLLGAGGGRRESRRNWEQGTILPPDATDRNGR